MKERYLSKTPFLTFVYISKCNKNLPGYFGNSQKRFLWTGLVYILRALVGWSLLSVVQHQNIKCHATVENFKSLDKALLVRWLKGLRSRVSQNGRQDEKAITLSQGVKPLQISKWTVKLYCVHTIWFDAFSLIFITNTQHILRKLISYFVLSQKCFYALKMILEWTW